MQVEVKPGKYIVAVSGGVDSVVLLDVLKREPGLAMVIAHFDHGIRPNSDSDRLFVQGLAEKYRLPFEYRREELGPQASEALARERRYSFLRSMKTKHRAEAIITAHHQDDEIETACINIIRGTYRKGLSSLTATDIIRPFLATTKQEIVAYANQKSLYWREDETNLDQKYLRNYIRQKLAASSPEIKEKLLQIIEENKVRGSEMDLLTHDIFVFGYRENDNVFERPYFISLPYTVSREVLAWWLRKYGLEFDRRNIELLVVALKTGRAHSRYDAGGGWTFVLSDNHISLQPTVSV